jgi:hypothetical protein
MISALSIDALKVDRRDAEVRVPELALDDDERDAFSCHLDGTCVTQLVWSEPSAHTGARGDPS